MSHAADRAVVERFYDEAINQRRLEVLDEILAPEFQGDKLEREQTFSTREQLKRGLGKILNAFPDYHQTIHDWIVADGKVVARWTTRGTHLGPYNGIAPTGRVIHEHGIDIFQVENGRIVAHWVELDLLGILRQMGFSDPLLKQ
jgi:steroid delta-isomerase-like uncharacterized protein